MDIFCCCFDIERVAESSGAVLKILILPMLILNCNRTVTQQVFIFLIVIDGIILNLIL